MADPIIYQGVQVTQRVYQVVNHSGWDWRAFIDTFPFSFFGIMGIFSWAWFVLGDWGDRFLFWNGRRPKLRDFLKMLNGKERGPCEK